MLHPEEGKGSDGEMLTAWIEKEETLLLYFHSTPLGLVGLLRCSARTATIADPIQTH